MIHWVKLTKTKKQETYNRQLPFEDKGKSVRVEAFPLRQHSKGVR